jgi:hypothetical protein
MSKKAHSHIICFLKFLFAPGRVILGFQPVLLLQKGTAQQNNSLRESELVPPG